MAILYYFCCLLLTFCELIMCVARVCWQGFLIANWTTLSWCLFACIGRWPSLLDVIVIHLWFFSSQASRPLNTISCVLLSQFCALNKNHPPFFCLPNRNKGFWICHDQVDVKFVLLVQFGLLSPSCEVMFHYSTWHQGKLLRNLKSVPCQCAVCQLGLISHYNDAADLKVGRTHLLWRWFHFVYSSFL